MKKSCIYWNSCF